MSSRSKNLNPQERVILTAIPPGFLNDLPPEDQRAIREIVGQPVVLTAYDEDGRAELEFHDSEGILHFIYVDAAFIEAADES